MQARARSTPTLPSGYRLLSLDSVDSTNAEAKRRALAGEKGPLWIWSLRQSAGRGRAGRDWQSYNGNLFASLLLSIACPLSTASQLGLVAGLAAYDAIARLIGTENARGGEGEPTLMLKWPNDVLYARKKIAGVLIENAIASDKNHCTLVVGTGINLAQHPKDLPQPATDLAREGYAIEPSEALQTLTATTDFWLRHWEAGASFQTIRKAWLDRAGPLGRTIQIKLPHEVLNGAFDGLDASGALKLKTESGAIRRITAGDVFFPNGV